QEMKTHIAFTSVLCLAAGLSHAIAADDVPAPLAFARYEPMMNRSPFAVATAAATPPPQAPNFAKDLYVANAGRLSADESVVTLASNTDKSLKEYLSSKGPNKNGYSISNIEWSDRVGATKVTIAKDGQFATLTFNQALLSQPVASGAAPQPQVPSPVMAQPVPTPMQQVPTQTTAVPAGGTMQPGATPVPASINQIRPAPIPTLPTPPPRVRGVIQRNPVNSATPPASEVQATDDQ
ncbi:MAG TPA: hypothetical protein VF551_09955, partial [Chthoniobacterales bacterium]